MMPSTLPRYREITRYLLERIVNGVFAPHHQIPPEEQLARDFGVSRMTANKAIRDLVHDGYLVRHPGLGTFVTDRKSESSLLEIHNIADEVRARGRTYRNEVRVRETVAADDEIALRLGVRLNTPVFHSVLVHYEDDVPIQLEDRYVNPRWVPHYLDADFSVHTPHDILQAASPLSDLEHIVEAVPADAEIADRLAIATGSACLRMTRRTWSDAQLISYAQLIHPGDRYKLRAQAGFRRAR